MNKKTETSQNSKEIPSLRSENGSEMKKYSGKLKKCLFAVYGAIMGIIAWYILYYTRQKMSHETWELFVAFLLLISGIWVLVALWLRGRKLRESECR